MVILRQTLWGYRWAILLVGVGLFGYSILLPYTYQTMGETAGLARMQEVLPEGLKALLKAQGALTPDAQSFLAAGYRHPVYLIALAAFAIAVAAGAVAREVERGTILILLARPISRYHMLLAKVAAMVLCILLLLVAAFLGTWVGVAANGLSGQVDMVKILMIEANAFLLAMAVGAGALLISARSSDGGQVIALGVGLLVALFFLDFLATLWEPVRSLGPVSLFHYYDPVSLVQQGRFTWLHLGVLAAVATVGLAGALLVFQRRDIAR